jgi:hypothetical protein
MGSFIQVWPGARNNKKNNKKNKFPLRINSARKIKEMEEDNKKSIPEDPMEEKNVDEGREEAPAAPNGGTPSPSPSKKKQKQVHGILKSGKKEVRSRPPPFPSE